VSERDEAAGHYRPGSVISSSSPPFAWRLTQSRRSALTSSLYHRRCITGDRASNLRNRVCVDRFHGLCWPAVMDTDSDSKAQTRFEKYAEFVALQDQVLSLDASPNVSDEEIGRRINLMGSITNIVRRKWSLFTSFCSLF
jgi:hypothetical protein